MVELDRQADLDRIAREEAEVKRVEAEAARAARERLQAQERLEKPR